MRALVGLVGAFALTGCGTIINGGHQEIAFASSTPGAEMSIQSFKGREVYNGPTGTVRLARDEQYTVTIRAAGFRDRKLTITKSMSGWMFGNLALVLPILWGVGVAVDAASGGLWSLDAGETQVTLQPATPPTEPVVASELHGTPSAPAHLGR
jgi:hypothetical protein